MQNSRFKGAYIDSGAVDFSDKLRTSRRKGWTRLELSKKPMIRGKSYWVEKYEGFLVFKSLSSARLHSSLEWRAGEN